MIRTQTLLKEEEVARSLISELSLLPFIKQP
jgi:hypothetical protein